MVEQHVGQRYKPDLVVTRDGQVRLWIDCGETSLRKLERVVSGNKIAQVVIVKDTLRHLEGYARLALDVLAPESRLRYLAFSDGLVQDLANAMRQRNRISCSLGPAGLRISLNGQSFTGTLISRRHIGSTPR